MVQKQTRRRSGLIIGALLALLLGVAATFFTLAMPIHLLESITTLSRLSRLMVQAEPPISPNDRALLAVLAGILTAGIGWVLVDWLAFGRAGMRTLIREREDEYEDEDADADAFRPTDPLDLVLPVPTPSDDWNPMPTGDARRPLSARTDIGDPPKPVLSEAASEVRSGGLGIDQLLPAINQILPEIAPPLLQPAFPQPTPPVPGIGVDLNGKLPTSWPPLDIATLDAVAPPSRPQPASGVPSWLPTPGNRFEPSEPLFGEPVPAAVAEPAPLLSLADPAPAARSEPEPVEQAAPPLPELQPFAPPSEPAALPPMPTPILSFPEPRPAVPDPAPEPPVAPLPAATIAPPPVSPQLPAVQGRSAPGGDLELIKALLAKLERKVEDRRTTITPAATLSAPAQARVELPAGFAAPPIGTFPDVLPEPVPSTPAKPQRHDDLLDQPLHLTLDLLRSMVKR